MKKKIFLTEQELCDAVSKTVSEIFTLKESPKKNIPNDYKPIGPQKFKLENGNEVESIITLQAESGQRCHIIEDDHCYVLYNQSKYDNCGSPVTHIFPEAFEALKKLPNPHL